MALPILIVASEFIGSAHGFRNDFSMARGVTKVEQHCARSFNAH